MMNEKRKCPCCGCYTIDENFGICPVCYFEYDPYQIKNPEEKGANEVTLNEARFNYFQYGACEERFISLVREPYEEEVYDDEEE